MPTLKKAVELTAVVDDVVAAAPFGIDSLLADDASPFEGGDAASEGLGSFASLVDSPPSMRVSDEIRDVTQLTTFITVDEVIIIVQSIHKLTNECVAEVRNEILSGLHGGKAVAKAQTFGR